MSRVFWDSMLFIYLVEDHPRFAPLVRRAIVRSFGRKDSLFTSHLSIAETLVGLDPGSEKEKIFLTTIREMDFTLVNFDGAAVETFRVLRSGYGLRPPDSLHLACAAATKADLFITGDGQLLKKHLRVPGIQFIAGLENAPL